MSVYDIADHPDFHFRTSDIVIRIWNSESGENDCENEVRGAGGFTDLLMTCVCVCVFKPHTLFPTVGVCLAQTSVGQVSRVDVSSKVEVVWADNSMTIVLPQVRLSSW